MRIALATDAWTPQGLASIACPSYPEIRLALSPGPYVARELKAFRRAIAAALQLDRGACRAAASGFSWHAAKTRFLAGLAPIPLPLRARLAVSRSSAIIARMAARRQASGTGDAN